MADIPLQMRGVIIACCILYNATWPEIESMTGVKEDTARKLMTTLIERAGNRDLNDLLEVAAPLPRPGRPPKVVDGTQESRALQQLAYDNPKLRFDELGKPLPSLIYIN
jgi:hypothetical protein